MKKILSLLIAITVVFGMARSAQAVTVQWADNGHLYEVVFSDNPTWFEARDAAAAMTYNGVSGYMATVTTAAEQSFLVTSFGGGPAIQQLWVGGYQDTSDPSYSEPNGGWRWITGEPWNTGADKPVFSFNNNYFFTHSEEHLITWWGTGGLNDYYYAPDDPYPKAQGYIVEYDPVPEPSTVTLFAFGALGLFGYGWRRRKQMKK